MSDMSLRKGPKRNDQPSLLASQQFLQTPKQMSQQQQKHSLSIWVKMVFPHHDDSLPGFYPQICSSLVRPPHLFLAVSAAFIWVKLDKDFFDMAYL